MTIVTLSDNIMKTIKASEFKAKCLQLMDEVAESGEPIVITKNSKPISLLVPYRYKPATLYGALKGSVITEGDIISPLGIEWEAQN
jgi:prevent-host-death family protein